MQTQELRLPPPLYGWWKLITVTCRAVGRSYFPTQAQKGGRKWRKKRIVAAGLRLLEASPPRPWEVPEPIGLLPELAADVPLPVALLQGR